VNRDAVRAPPPAARGRREAFANVPERLEPPFRPAHGLEFRPVGPPCHGHGGCYVDDPGIIRSEGIAMLWTIAVILLVLWALGLLTSTTLGGFVHVLLVLAVVVLLIGVVQGRRAA
jgi:hypothetical protein